MPSRESDRPPFDDGGNGDWQRYRLFVMEALREIKGKQNAHDEILDLLVKDVAWLTMRDKAGLKMRIAIASAMIGGVVTFAGELFLRALK